MSQHTLLGLSSENLLADRREVGEVLHRIEQRGGDGKVSLSFDSGGIESERASL